MFLQVRLQDVIIKTTIRHDLLARVLASFQALQLAQVASNEKLLSPPMAAETALRPQLGICCTALA